MGYKVSWADEGMEDDDDPVFDPEAEAEGVFDGPARTADCQASREDRTHSCAGPMRDSPSTLR